MSLRCDSNVADLMLYTLLPDDPILENRHKKAQVKGQLIICQFLDFTLEYQECMNLFSQFNHLLLLVWVVMDQDLTVKEAEVMGQRVCHLWQE